MGTPDKLPFWLDWQLTPIICFASKFVNSIQEMIRVILQAYWFSSMPSETALLIWGAHDLAKTFYVSLWGTQNIWCWFCW